MIDWQYIPLTRVSRTEWDLAPHIVTYNILGWPWWSNLLQPQLALYTQWLQIREISALPLSLLWLPPDGETSKRVFALINNFKKIPPPIVYPHTHTLKQLLRMIYEDSMGKTESKNRLNWKLWQSWKVKAYNRSELDRQTVIFRTLFLFNLKNSDFNAYLKNYISAVI